MKLDKLISNMDCRKEAIVSKYWSQVLKTVEPYVPGEQPRDREYIKLNTNENPYPPSPLVLEAMKKEISGDLRLYPDPTCHDLLEAIGAYYGKDTSQVFVGNGSDEVLAFAFLAYFNQGDRILYPDITYSFYPVYANMFQISYDLIPLNEDFKVKVEDYQRENKGVIIANPNAPTGKLLSLADIKQILDWNKDQVVIVDEAYIDFGGQSAVSLIDEYDNLLVVQTMSKSRSLAGMRIGFAIGHPDLIDGLNRVKNSINSYTIDRLALVAGRAAMEDKEYFEKTRLKIMETREWVTRELRAIGFDVIPSAANFIFASPASMEAEKLFLQLKEKGLLVRYFNKPRISEYLRISIGTDKEMEALVKGVKDILGK